MSTMARIFIVLNMLMAVAFAMASLSLYAKKTNWAQQSKVNEDAKNKLTKELSDMKAQLENVKGPQENELRNLRGENETLKATLAEVRDSNSEIKGKFEKLTGTYNLMSDSVNELRNTLEGLHKRNDELLKKANEAISERTKAVSEKEFAETRAIEVAADLQQAMSELEELAKNNADLVNRVTSLNIALQKVTEQTGIDPLKTPTPSTPISGAVLQVEESVGIVILNVGESDKVERGMEFVISRGDQYIAKVRVRTLYGDMCSATIIPGLKKGAIAVNDMAQTL